MERGLCAAQRVAGWSRERMGALRATYLAMCAKVDDQLGRILRALREEGIYDETAVLFFSDHGDYTGDFGIVEKAQNCFPDCLVRVPLVIKPPKSLAVDAGVHDQLAELTDVCATVADLAGIRLSRQTFSRSLVPAMRDRGAEHRAFVCCEGGRLPGEAHCSEYDPDTFSPDDLYAPRQRLQASDGGAHTKAVMIRTKRYKYVRRLQERDEFYDLARGERSSLIDDPSFAAEIGAMKERLADWYLETCDIVPTDQDDRFSFEFLRNNLAALGFPAPVGRLLELGLRLRGKTAGQFIDSMRRRAESGQDAGK